MSEHLLTNIGKRIRELRLQSGYKLVEIAEKAGVSKGLLSKVENGRTVPSLPVLLSIIQSLGTVPEDFFKNLQFEPTKPYIKISPGEHSLIKKEEDAVGFLYNFILNKPFENFILEAVILEIEPGSKRKKVSVDAYEFKYVLEGEINYQIDEEFILLKKGDTLLYDGKVPHVPHNETDKPAKMLVLYFYYNKSKDD